MDNTNDVTICRVVNSVDKTVMVLITHWYEDYVKLGVIRSDDSPLEGQITKVILAQPAETLCRTKDEYLTEMKKELAGKENEVKYELKKNDINQIYTLTWKRNIWKRGSVICEPLLDMKRFASLVHGILLYKSTVEESEIKYRKENESLKRKVSDMETAIMKMTSISNTMENALCRKFLFILKRKKDIIRNLKDEIKKLSKVNSDYDKITDVSDNESEETELVYPSKRIKLDNLRLEPREEVLVEKKSRGFADSMFEKIAECIERENSLLPSEEMKLADNDNSNDSDIKLRYEDSQIVLQSKNHLSQ